MREKPLPKKILATRVRYLASGSELFGESYHYQIESSSGLFAIPLAKGARFSPRPSDLIDSYLI